MTQATTDTDVMTLFLSALAKQLDRESASWREESTILLDNAAWHTNAVMKERLAKIGLPIIFSA